jgi:hypothetical protein
MIRRRSSVQVTPLARLSSASSRPVVLLGETDPGLWMLVIAIRSKWTTSLLVVFPGRVSVFCARPFGFVVGFLPDIGCSKDRVSVPGFYDTNRDLSI